ncbi:hypothetical protein NE172_05135 [Clostridium botulinum]|uniref:Uncharacterized protein n=1 Tax=Clostridium botulinum TaxID=1491 RepID=A0A6B4JJ62_CLOBO|nr:hypothetical protein [Clostridium botulinum]EES49726.1 hypothetical protein CLO_1397 [Clostridium botulinum E1 str. 'BoNT E Beluga']MBY6760545.1 hypothetical protein [Clostridium botulinum]MBY6919452.1 hypothetical protein [Clostridium botulinum]MCR1130330.1 hypothetical protein [Clostridium botulinum]NFJ56911.1 hypothetical protein [Clostridium botulinum]
MKKFFKYNIMYIIFISIVILLLKEFGVLNNVIEYMLFESKGIYFKDLLSIGITILAIVIGAIITAATVLMSMCNARLMKLINKYGKSKYIVKIVKESIITGIIAVCLYAIIYSNLDFSILWLRLIILYCANLSLIIFSIKSKLLIELVIKLLSDSFTENESLVVESKFVNPKLKEKYSDKK